MTRHPRDDPDVMTGILEAFSLLAQNCHVKDGLERNGVGYLATEHNRSQKVIKALAPQGQLPVAICDCREAFFRGPIDERSRGIKERSWVRYLKFATSVRSAREEGKERSRWRGGCMEGRAGEVGLLTVGSLCPFYLESSTKIRTHSPNLLYLLRSILIIVNLGTFDVTGDDEYEIHPEVDGVRDTAAGVIELLVCIFCLVEVIRFREHSFWEGALDQNPNATYQEFMLSKIGEVLGLG